MLGGKWSFRKCHGFKTVATVVVTLTLLMRILDSAALSGLESLRRFSVESFDPHEFWSKITANKKIILLCVIST